MTLNTTLAGRIATAGLALLLAQTSLAAVSPEEAQQLGATLTAFGAEKAGNADGSIPAYTGGLANTLGYSPKTSARYVDPYKDEKPLYSITAANMAQYEASLAPGTRALLKAQPGFRVDVYPSHRSMRYPTWVLQNTVKNATTAKVVGKFDGDAIEGGDTGNLPHAGIPFPIPKRGTEVMWNHLMQFTPVVSVLTGTSLLVDSTGAQSEPTIADDYWLRPWYDISGELRRQTLNSTFVFSGTITSPPSKAGGAILTYYFADMAQGSKAWFYIPGQRRIRIAPDFSYDNRISDGMFWDDFYGYQGRMDRFDFKLVGKREVIVPYNVFGVTNTMPSKDALGKRFINPDAVRWEKHRVWVVDATRKPGASHVESRRTFYIDEDAWCVTQVDGYNDAGEVSRVIQVYSFPAYGSGGINTATWNLYDLQKGSYSPFNIGYADADRMVRDYDSIDGLTIPMTPRALLGSGVK